LTLLREGYDRARGILPDEEFAEPFDEPEEAGVGFAPPSPRTKSSTDRESELLELRARPRV